MAGILALETQKRTGLSANKVFFGWWIVGAAIAIQFLHGGLLFSAFGAYFVRLQVGDDQPPPRVFDDRLNPREEIRIFTFDLPELQIDRAMERRDITR